MMFYNDRQKHVLQLKLPREQAYKGTLVTSLRMAFEIIEKNEFGILAKHGLDFVSLLNPNDIPSEFINSVLDISIDDSLGVLDVLTNYSRHLLPKGE